MIGDESELVNQQHIIKNRWNIIGHIWSPYKKTRVIVFFKTATHLYLHHDYSRKGVTDMSTVLQKWKFSFINTFSNI